MRLTEKAKRPESTKRKYKAINTCYYNSPDACANKLGEYEDIEDKLGIDLSVLFKAFQQGYIYLDIKENRKNIREIIKFEVGGILFDKDDKVWRLTNDDRYDGAYWGSLATNKNYGKIWALTKEELEKYGV